VGGKMARAKSIGPATAELSFYHLGQRDASGRPTRDRSLNTVGGRILRDPKPGAIDYEAEAIYQFGHVSGSLAATAPRLEASASFVHVDLGYTFRDGWTPRLSVEFDRASGDGSGGSYGRFDTLFGMRRADLAPAGLYNAVGRANIVTPGLRLEATPSKAVDWFIGYRLMWLADRTDAFDHKCARCGRALGQLRGAADRCAHADLDRPRTAAIRGRWGVAGQGPLPARGTQCAEERRHQICLAQSDRKLLIRPAISPPRG
jgi:hypothetical protein